MAYVFETGGGTSDGGNIERGKFLHRVYQVLFQLLCIRQEEHFGHLNVQKFVQIDYRLMGLSSRANGFMQNGLLYVISM